MTFNFIHTRRKHGGVSQCRSNPAGRLIRCCLLAVVGFHGTELARAGAIEWRAPVTIAGDSDVATSGTLAYAYDLSNAAATVNTVPFAAGNSSTALGTNVIMSGFGASTTAAFGSGSGSPWSGLGSFYQTILRGAAYAGNNSPATITLRNLAIGHVYLVQIWVSDNRSGATSSRTETVSGGGNTVTLSYNSTGAAGGVGQYTIGTFAADAATKAITLTGVLPAGTNSSQINALQVRDLGRTITWSGGSFPSGTNVWDVGVTGDWRFNGTATTFGQGDYVTFDDTDSATPAIQLTGNLSPAAVTVSSANNHAFGGTGFLSGSMMLSKSGVGSLTLSPASVAVSTTTTTGSASVTVASSSGLLSGMWVSGTGIPAGTTVAGISGTDVTLSQVATANGTVNVTFYQRNSFTGVNTISGGTVSLGGFQQNGIGSGAVVLQGGTLSLNGVTGSNATDYGTISNDITVPSGQSGTLKLMQRGNFASRVIGSPDSTLNVQVAYIRGTLTGDWSGFSGQTNVTGAAGSEFRVGNGNGFGTATINLGSGVMMDQSFNPPNDGLSGGTTQTIGMLVGSGKLGGQPVVGRVVNWQVGGNNASGTFNGVIQDASTNGTGAARITKVGTGTWTLANPCTYSGPTSVNAGTLIVSGLPNSSGVIVAADATLGGTGTITGPVTIQMDSIFQAGNTLVFAGGVNLVQPTGSEMTLTFGDTGSGFGVLDSHQLSGGNITASGTVNVNVTVQSGTLVPGTYVLAQGGSTGSGTAQVTLSGAPANLTATLDATSQPGTLLLIVGTVAFPGAEGFGATATGGRGGSVYHVTNLNNSGAGSFRDAVSQPNRTVVFDVGGIINLTSEVEVQDNITIAGQTAPGQGISTFGDTVYLNHGFGAADSYGHSNIIIRHMRFREGYKESGQAYSLALKPAHKVMIDHCSIQIGNWQTFSITYNETTGEQPTDITVQNSIIGAGVSNQLGVLDWNPVNLTWHHNLFLDNSGRDPKASGKMQIINDVVYNYVLGIYGDDGEQCDFIGNYHIAGPDTNATSVNQGMNYGGASTGVYYVSGNYWDNNRDGSLGGVPLVPGPTYSFNPVISATPICNPPVPVSVDPARLAYYKVISAAGVSLSRDPLDAALIDQVVSLGTRGPGGTMGASYVPGMYMKHQTPYTDPVSGNPIPAWSITGGTAPLDTDQDGMPDDWERATGSNVNVADNNMTATGGYTRLENYLNWMADPHARVPEYTSSTIDLSQYTAGFNNHSPTFTVTAPAHGAATLLADGHTVQYTPLNGYSGLDSINFTVTASDGNVLTQTLGILVNLSGRSLKWQGGLAGNAWDATTQNWLDNVSPAAFRNGDSVTFDDSGAANPVVQLTGALYPGAVTVNNTSAFSFTGSGALGGVGNLTKSGTGALTINTANSHTGGTVVNGGTVNLSGYHAGATGGYALNVVNSATATLNLGSASQTTATTVVSGVSKSIQLGAIPGVNTATSNSAQTVNVNGAAGFPTTVTNSGSLAVARNATMTIGDNSTWNQSGTVNVQANGGYGANLTLGTAAGSSAAMVYTGSGPIQLSQTASTSSVSTMTIRSGVLTTGQPVHFNGASGIGTGYGRIILTNAGKIKLSADIPQLVTGDVSGRVILSNGGGGIIDTNGFSTAIDRAIADSNPVTFIGSLTKTGAGTLTLSNTSNYSGTTTVSGGTLMVTGSIATSTATVSSSGTLGGTGTTGGLTISAGGTLAPGDGNPGTLNTGQLALAAGSFSNFRLGIPSDRVNVTGALALGGTITLSDTGSAVSGSYALFTHTGSLTGSAAVNPPSGFTARLDTSTPGLVSVILSASTFATWQRGCFSAAELANPAISGPYADKDKDGIANLLEFATATDPGVGNTVPAFMTRNGANLEFTYTRSKAAVLDGIVFTVEWSDDLSDAGWSAAGILDQDPVPIFQNADTETLRILIPPGSDRRFVRLRISKP